jgi:hypothetical protein
MYDIVVHFGNGEKYSPTTKLTFKQGSRTGVIDLPGDDRIIKKIKFKYGNLPGTGKARVRVYGLLVAEDNDHRDPPAETAFDPRGWEKLGTRVVNGKRDTDTIKVGKYEGRFDQIVFVVEDADLDVKKFTVQFEKGKKWTPRINHHFKAGSRTRVIDLPGADRRIKKITLKYGRPEGEARATVTVYGRDSKQGSDPQPAPQEDLDYGKKGWKLLGEQSVNGKNDHDSFEIAKKDSKLSKIVIVVLDSDLELDDVIVQFRSKKNPRKLAVKHSFKEGQRSRAIDLPINKKAVGSIEVWYGNTPGGGNARVQIWGK